MGIIRPATPGFLVTLAATALLAAVSFNVPILKSIFFLKATVDNGDISTSVTFGTLGYCAIFQGNTTCSKPSVGYQLDINELVGNKLPIQIPEVLVKWVTYALVLHIVALVLSAVSAVFGLLAHVREMSMTYCSTCVSGFAASVALIAFVFDLVLFFLTKSRINAVDGGHAEIGISIWLTLAAWILLFFAGCFYGLGRCCVRRRPRGPDREARPAPDGSYSEQMRMEAVKAEQIRQANQAAGKKEVGLPAFPEYERQPLTSKVEYVEDGDEIVPYEPARLTNNNTGVHSAIGAGVGAGTAAYGRTPQPHYAGGYAQALPGTRSVDAYYNGSPQQSPQPSPGRQPSVHTAPSMYSEAYAPSIAPTTVTAAAVGGYLSTDPYRQYNHQQQASGASYGHAPRGTSYHSALSHQDTYGAEVSDPFAARVPQTAFNADGYNTTGNMYNAPAANPGPSTNPYRAGSTYPERNYTLGGGGYGENVVPALNQSSYPQYGSGSPAPSTSAYTSSSTPTAVLPPINTRIPSPPMPQPQNPRGPRDLNSSNVLPAPRVESPEPQYEDSPPMYDDALAKPPGSWGEKGQRR